ncbi:MAG: LEA type 2 family protein [bacterium]
MRGFIIYILTILLIIILSCARSNIEKLKEECSAKVEGINIVRADLFSVLLEVDVLVINPTPYSVIIKGIDYDVYINDELVDKHSAEQYIELTKGGETPLKFPISISYRSIEDIAPDFAGKRTVMIKITGDVILQHSLTRFKVAFSFLGPITI